MMLPNVNHTHFLLLGVGGVSVTSSLDYAGPDVRYVINSSAFRRLSLLSSERKQPALPAYQVDAISLSLWGVDNSNTRYDVMPDNKLCFSNLFISALVFLSLECVPIFVWSTLLPSVGHLIPRPLLLDPPLSWLHPLSQDLLNSSHLC